MLSFLFGLTRVLFTLILYDTKSGINLVRWEFVFFMGSFVHLFPYVLSLSLLFCFEFMGGA